MSFFKANASEAELQGFGFRLGEKGTHSSRTIMFDDLVALFSVNGATTERSEYGACIIESNCLGKETVATRRHSNQNLGELYGLDNKIPLFRVFRFLWDASSDEKDKRLLTLQCALARDPLLLASAQLVLPLQEKAEFSREGMRARIKDIVGERLNEKILDKVIRNTASSWTQSGHFVGRTFKIRSKVTPAPATIAFGLCLAYRAGFRGQELFSSGWVNLLDCQPAYAQDVAIEAKRLGFIDMRILGEIIEINFDRLDPYKVKAGYGTN